MRNVVLALRLGALSAAVASGCIDSPESLDSLPPGSWGGPVDWADEARETTDESQHPACVPGESFCLDGSRRLCNDDGRSSVLVQDCSAEPYEGCAVGPCRQGEDPEGTCCVAREPFCLAEVEIGDGPLLEVEYAGLWDGDLACTGTSRDDAVGWALWARVAGCDSRFVRVVVSGYRDGLVVGRTYPLCREDGSVPGLRVSVTSGETTYTNHDEGCRSVSGTIVLHEYGDRPGAPFRISVRGTLVDGEGGTVAFRADSEGRLASR